MQQSTPRLVVARTQQIKALSGWWFLRNKSLVRRNKKTQPWVEGLLLPPPLMVVPVVRLLPTTQFEWKKESTKWSWSKSHASGKLFGILTNGTTTTMTFDATTGRQITTMTKPSDGDDDTTPATMTTDTTKYTINWFWPRVAVCVPIITINSSFRPNETIWGHDNDTKRNNQLLSISVSFMSMVLQQTKQSTPCFGRTRQSCAATTTPNATTNSSFRPSEPIPYNSEDNKQQ